MAATADDEGGAASPPDPEPPPSEAFARSSVFWSAVGWAAVLGIAMGLAGLVYLLVVEDLPRAIWGEAPSGELASGQLWWIPLAGGFGLIVGLLRTRLKVPREQTNIFDEIRDAHVDPRTAPKTVLISIFSLIGGTSLGPEAGLGTMGGGLGAWISKWRGMNAEMTGANTTTGIAGAFGGLFTAPLLGPLMIMEIRRPDHRRFAPTLIPTVVASTLSFAIFFPIIGHTFLAIYDLPAYELKLWHLLVAVGVGVLGAVMAVITGVAMAIFNRLCERLARRPVLLATGAGLLIGLIGFLLPLTLFSGSTQLESAIEEGPALGIALLVAIVLAKVVTFALSMTSGFIGGAIFPMIFIGGVTGLVLHQAIPGIPVTLAVTCGMAAVPGAAAAVPFSLIAIVGFAVALEPSDVAPIGIAVLTSYLIVVGLGLAGRAGRARAAQPAEEVAIVRDLEAPRPS